MTERGRLLRWIGPLALLVALAVATAVPQPGWLRLGAPGTDAVDGMSEALGALPGRPRVLVGFDPDLGTYAEVRDSVRALLGELLDRDAALTFVSLTAEGRALAIAELDRLDRLAGEAATAGDLGFIAGAEAALVDLAGSISGQYDAIVVVGGNDLGPRSWVEQVVPRIDDVPLLAVTPVILLPEVRPYLATGQVDAGLVTPRDGAAYRASVDPALTSSLSEPREPANLAILLGMLAAIVVLGHALGVGVMARLGAARPRDAG